MTLAPQAAALGSVTCDGTTVGGVLEAPIVDKTLNVDVTSLGDTAVARFPTIKDADFSLKIAVDSADTGQDKIWASKAAKTCLTYVRNLNASTTYYTLDAYVGDISWSAGPADEIIADVTLIVTGGATLTYA